MKRFLFIPIFFFFSFSSFAYFCPGNFNRIELGFTLDQVQQICGKPLSVKTTKVESQNGPQEWNYYINLVASAQGSVKVIVGFVNGKVVNLNINGIGLASSPICGGTVSYGDTMESVKAACGEPVYISKPAQGTPGSQTQTTEITELTYQAAQTVIFVFENGKLTGTK